MADLTLSSPNGYKGGSAQTSGPFVGYDGMNYVLRYNFKTPSTGYITKVTFGTTFRTYSGGAVSTNNPIRIKITTSATSHTNAGAGFAYDATLTSSGSVEISGLKLAPNTTYYLYLFPGSTNGSLSYCYDNSGKDLSSLTSDTTIGAYTLSVTAGAGSSISVRRISSTIGSSGSLSNGATIYSGDVLTISFNVSTGYNLGVHTVNGITFESGGSHTVTNSVSIVSSATVKSFKLSISAGTGSTIVVKRTNSPKGGASIGNLNNNATIYYSDVLQVTFTTTTGYNLGSHTVNGSAFTSGGTHTVTGAVAVVSTASLKTFKLSISAGTGSTITVKRGGTALSNGATITYGDVLTINFGVSAGYNLGTHTVNGSSFDSGDTHTVTGAVAVVSTATVKSFRLTISAGPGSTVTVIRTKSPLQGASSGQLADGATIYYNDVLSISFAGSAIYEILTGTVNGAEIASGSTTTVTAAVTLVTTTRMRGYVYLTVGGAVKKYRVVIYHNSKWVKYRPIILHSDTDISAFGVGDTIVIATSLPVSTEGDTIIIGGA